MIMAASCTTGSAEEPRPIGIFDSGVGGLTVLQALHQRLPGESFLYLGDTARLPYGTKSSQTVQRYALNAAAHLIRHNIKLLVVACNTASSHALPALTAASPVPVVGVVEPGVRAAMATGAQRVGVIGTEATILSGSYQQTLQQLAPDISVKACPCPLLVPLAEEGWGSHSVTEEVARHYLGPLLDWGIGTLILGCTHYPLLRPALSRVVGSTVRLVDSAASVTEAIVSQHSQLLAPAAARPNGSVEIQLTDASDSFLRVARAILGKEPERLELVNL
jgi:glutamate racemase